MGKVLCRVIGGGSSVGNAKAEDVINGKTFSNDDDVEVQGTLQGTGTAIEGDVLKGSSFYNTNLQNKLFGTLELTGDAGEYDTIKGKSFYSNDPKVKKTGTLPEYPTGSDAQSCTLYNNYLYYRIKKGAYRSTWSGDLTEVKYPASYVINALGIATATNFNVAQYTSQRLQFTWAKPDRSQKMWSGIRITARQDRYPNNPDDSSYKWDSNSVYLITDVIPSGYWYIIVWNYITWNNNSQRTYGGIVRQLTFNNIAISGSQNFTGSTTWRVPNAVRSIQVFLVGGGGGTSSQYANESDQWCGGGGGGYTSTAYLNVNPGETLSINVGAGGVPGGDGGTSSIYRGGSQLIAAAGGKNAYNDGGNGGSGGGAGAYSNAGNGGRNGGNGESAPWNDDPTGIGYGQGRTTHCPWDDIAYAGGGGGGAESSSGAGRGFDGGGDGGAVDNAENGAANTGGGAGGSGHDDSIGASHGRSGGSGIVRIRW